MKIINNYFKRNKKIFNYIINCFKIFVIKNKLNNMNSN